MTGLVGHDDAPNGSSCTPKGARYSFALAPSGNIIGKVMAPLVRNEIVALKMKKIPWHEEIIWSRSTRSRGTKSHSHHVVTDGLGIFSSAVGSGLRTSK